MGDWEIEGLGDWETGRQGDKAGLSWSPGLPVDGASPPGEPGEVELSDLNEGIQLSAGHLGAGGGEHARRDVGGEDTHAPGGQVGGVLASAAAELDDTLAGLEESIEPLPDGGAHQATDGAASEAVVVVGGHPVKRMRDEG